MKRVGILLVLTIISVFASAQTTFDLENLSVPDTGFWYGQDTAIYNNGFGNADLFFVNNYYTSAWGDYWDGFAFSTWTDTTTEGYTNQWSVYAGKANSGQIFGLGYVSSDFNTHKTIPIVCRFSSPMYPQSIYLTNSTYTALAIKNGTQFSEPFSDGDFYYVKITGYYNGDTTASIIHFLADYRNGQTFVQKDWQLVDLTSLGLTDSLTFDVFSTDTGAYGINTPAYFCFDDFTYSATAKVYNKNKITVYPNPATDFIKINAENIISFEIFDIQARKILSGKGNFINVKSLPEGIYFLKAYSYGKSYEICFVKN